MKTNLNLQDADGFYEQLLDAHQGLGEEQSALLNVRLILLLANLLIVVESSRLALLRAAAAGVNC